MDNQQETKYIHYRVDFLRDYTNDILSFVFVNKPFNKIYTADKMI